MADRDNRAPQPGSASQDPEAAARQEQTRRDAAQIRSDAQRVEATTPREVRDKTVGEIVDEANRRAER